MSPLARIRHGLADLTPLYYLRFMFYGVLMLWPGPAWPLFQAIAAIHNEYRNQPADARGDPMFDVAECLYYWDADE
jgi:hypothetical protein